MRAHFHLNTANINEFEKFKELPYKPGRTYIHIASELTPPKNWTNVLGSWQLFLFFSALGTRDMFSRLWCGLQVFLPLAAVPCSLGTGYKHLGVSLFPSKFFHWIACLNCLKEIFTVLSFLIGTLRSEDGNGSERVAEKVNSPSFNLHRDYSKSLTLTNEGEPS